MLCLPVGSGAGRKISINHKNYETNIPAEYGAKTADGGQKKKTLSIYLSTLLQLLPSSSDRIIPVFKWLLV